MNNVKRYGYENTRVIAESVWELIENDCDNIREKEIDVIQQPIDELQEEIQAIQAENERLNALLRLATKVSVAGVDINKLKADAVREYGEHLRMMAIVRTVPNTPEEYANKLEAGE